MGNHLIPCAAKSPDHHDGFEAHGVCYPPNYTKHRERHHGAKYKPHHEKVTDSPDVGSKSLKLRRNNWLHHEYQIQNLVMSGGGSKGYAFVGGMKVKLYHVYLIPGHSRFLINTD